MKFIEIIFNPDCKPTVQGVVTFDEITKEMVEDGEHEDILREKADERASGCDPIPVFFTFDEALELAQSLQIHASHRDKGDQ